ncbi:MAG: hypothetical protein ACOX4W_03510 [Bacilli bacterium]
MIKETTYKEYIEENEFLVYAPRGVSMLPLIKEGIDSVRLVKIKRPIKKYDVLLYSRENGSCVLHRVVRVCKESYDMMGDNQWIIERGVKKDNIIALMDGVYKGEKFISINSFRYKIYARFRVWFRFFRRVNNYIKRRVFKRNNKEKNK